MGCASSKNDLAQGGDFELAEPVLDFDTKAFRHENIEVAQCSVQGWRRFMEDVALVQCGVTPKQDMLALGVFDGHSGREAAQFAREKLLGHIQAADEWKRGDLSRACVKGFLSADEAMRKSDVKSGTTAVLALVTPEEIVVANCGDSRSVLCRGGRQFPMSLDHKPGRKAERRRIIKSGGFLDETDAAHPRVVCDKLNVSSELVSREGTMSLATSRALGDFDFKANPSMPPEQQMVSPVPEFFTRPRVPEDEFLILASDGIWDVIDNPGIVQLIREEVANLEAAEARSRDAKGQPCNGSRPTPVYSVGALARAVLKRCQELGSRDNMTLVLADLRPKPPPDPDHPGFGEEATPGLGVGQDLGGQTSATEDGATDVTVVPGQSHIVSLGKHSGGDGGGDPTELPRDEIELVAPRGIEFRDEVVVLHESCFGGGGRPGNGVGTMKEALSCSAATCLGEGGRGADGGVKHVIPAELSTAINGAGNGEGSVVRGHFVHHIEGAKSIGDFHGVKIEAVILEPDGLGVSGQPAGIVPWGIHPGGVR